VKNFALLWLMGGLLFILGCPLEKRKKNQIKQETVVKRESNKQLLETESKDNDFVRPELKDKPLAQLSAPELEERAAIVAMALAGFYYPGFLVEQCIDRKLQIAGDTLVEADIIAKTAEECASEAQQDNILDQAKKKAAQKDPWVMGKIKWWLEHYSVKNRHIFDTIKKLKERQDSYMAIAPKDLKATRNFLYKLLFYISGKPSDLEN
jgi:hypothetical protein